MKVLTIIGTRPNFIKQFAFGRACRLAGVECLQLHTGQHYERALSDMIFQELDIPQPEYRNTLERSTPAGELSQIMGFIEAVIHQELPNVVVVFGDVTSTMAGALAASKLGVPVAHVEGGVRGGNRHNPEELNRQVAERCAHLHFAHIDEAYQTLLREGVAESEVVLTGDIMKDSLKLILEEKDIQVSDQGYVAMTMHRAENTDNPKRLNTIVRAMLACPRPIRFLVHPRTKAALENHGLMETLQASDTIELLPPLGYVDTIRLLAGANRVLSDSGGVRREAYILGKPVISLTEMVWVPAMVEAGWELVADVDEASIAYGLSTFQPPEERPEIFGDGKAAERMVEELQNRFKDFTYHSVIGITNTDSLIAMAMKQRQKRHQITRYSEPLHHLTVVIPCYNEEAALPTLFFRINQLHELIDGQRYRVGYVFVDDGSSDGTWEMLSSHFGNSTSVRLIRNEHNLGYGGALRRGLLAAEGDLVATIDADTNYDIRSIPELLKAMTPDAHLVTASAFMNEGSWNYPSHRFIFSRGVVVLYRYLLQEKACDVVTFTCGFRIYRGDVVKALVPEANDFLANAEILVKALLAGLSVKQTPSVIHERMHGQSKLRTLRTIQRHLGFMWRLWRKRIAIPVIEESKP
ncbi:MAG: UDP-N-acetylglucosamine 2-epimerase (non-hydrolyzing) [Magnetococcales bacterium]|nr:UDP-N-acetylglucosamine 2-epimerase (non-hydrolyzing) [Magnetococcales bacterium]